MGSDVDCLNEELQDGDITGDAGLNAEAAARTDERTTSFIY